MELMTKQGYKQTEVGLIPEDWKFEKIEQHIDLLTGFPFPSSKYSNDGIRLLKGANVKRGQTDWQEKLTTFWNEDVHKYKQYELKDGDLVIAMDGSLVGRSYAMLSKSDLPALLLQRVARIRSKKIDTRYLKFFVGSDWFVKYSDSVKTVTAIPHISPKDIRFFKIPLPPTLTEQKAIATALSDVDALIASLEQTITKKKAIKQGAMQQLLTPPHKGGKRLPGFSGEWVEKTLGDVGVCIRGVTYSGDSDLYPFDNSDSIRLLRSNNVFDKNIVIKNLQYVKKEKVKSHQIMKSKDILICMANGSKALVGKAGQFNGASMQYTFGAFMGIFRPNIDEWDGDFLFNIFSTNLFRCHLDIQLSGSSINNLNPSDIEDFKFHIPSNPEQKAIAQILSDMDAEITQLETKKEKYQVIKQGMMQELLTGKTRLV
jgi:type I restriction enzyme S subunit